MDSNYNSATAAVADLEPFNPAHPPKMKNPEVQPAAVSASEILGEYNVPQAEFEYVADPLYPWRTMPRTTPVQEKRYQETRRKQKAEVSHYRVRRERFWKQIKYAIYNTDTTVTLTTTTGMEWMHEQEKSQDITKEIGLTLGLALEGDIMAPDVPPVASISNLGGNLEFTAHLSHTLHFSTRDSTTYRKEETLSVQKDYKAGVIYIDWQIWERLTLLRVAAKGITEKISVADAATDVLCGDFLDPNASIELTPPLTTGQTTLQPGGSIVYSTKPVGLKTYLYAKPHDAGVEGEISYHVELCCHDTHVVKIDPNDVQTYGFVKVDLSDAAGALVTVNNTGWSSVDVHTDY